MDMTNFSKIKNEIILDAQGRGFISRRGLAKLLGISHTSILPDRMSKKLSKALEIFKNGVIIEGGKLANPESIKDTALSKNGAIWIPDVEIPIYAQHFAYIARSKSLQAAEFINAFAAVGIRKWIQSIKEEETPVLEPVQEVSSQKLMLQAMKELMNVYEYADDKKGLQDILDFAKVQSNSIQGTLTVQDVFEEMKIAPSRSLNIQICLQVAQAYRNLTQKEPGKTRREYYCKSQNQDKKVKRFNLVNSYPAECKVIIENAIMKNIGRYDG
jgi:hypothetical protein